MRIGTSHACIDYNNFTSDTSLVMPDGDPRDGFFDPTLTLMIDSYIINERKYVLNIAVTYMLSSPDLLYAYKLVSSITGRFPGM